MPVRCCVTCHGQAHVYNVYKALTLIVPAFAGWKKKAYSSSPGPPTSFSRLLQVRTMPNSQEWLLPASL